VKKQINSLLFTFFLFVIFVFMAFNANDFADLAKFFPMTVAIISANIALLSMILQGVGIYKEWKKTKNDETDTDMEAPFSRLLRYIAWTLGYVILIYFIGFIISTIIFLLSFFIIESKFKYWVAFLNTAIVIGLLLFFSGIMNLQWPTGLFNIMTF